MEAPLMQGGAANDFQFKLHDIGDYQNVDDFFPIFSGSMTAINIALALGRMGVLGSVTFNSYFDTFGLEGILSNTSLAVIVIQLARWLYTKFYTVGGRPWSPLVFISIVAGVQLIHDLILYFGAINVLAPGKNEMIDALRAYASENGSRAIGGHVIFILVCALFAMLFKDLSFLTTFVIVTVTFYLLPFVIAIIAPRAVPVVKAPAQPAQATPASQGNGPRVGPTVLSPKREAFTMYGANGMLS